MPQLMFLAAEHNSNFWNRKIMEEDPVKFCIIICALLKLNIYFLVLRTKLLRPLNLTVEVLLINPLACPHIVVRLFGFFYSVIVARVVALR